MSVWYCEVCAWQWPLDIEPSQTAECDHCGGVLIKDDLGLFGYDYHWLDAVGPDPDDEG